jgi:redox-sensitive bicupin YhaK (pirin superfamily)
VFVTRMSPGRALDQKVPLGFGWYLYCIEGSVSLNGEHLSTGDAAKIIEEDELRLEAAAATELVAVEVEV